MAIRVTGEGLKLWTMAALMAVTSFGCASFGPAREARVFEIDNTWTRSTLKKDFLGFRRLNRFSPIVLEKMVIQGNSIDGIIAYDRQRGTQLWRFDTENGVEGGAQVAGDKVYFGSSDGEFYCLDAADGKVVWTYPVRAETLAPPTVEDGVVYFQNGADVVYALDAATGKQLWGYNRQVSGSLSIRSTTRPVVSGETIYAGFSDGFVVALKKRDGGLVWERKIGKGARSRDVDSTPVIDQGSVYVASYDGTLVSLNAETGEVNWSVEEGAYVPVTVGQGAFSDRLYYATANGTILFLDKRSGKVLSEISLKGKGIATQPTLYKSYLIYGESEGAMVVADADSGKTVGRFEPGYGLVSRPVVFEASQEAYFISNAANLYALKLGFRRVVDRLPWQVSSAPTGKGLAR